MTACPPRERLAAAASGDDAEALAHAETCATCREQLTTQLAMRSLLHRLPAPPLVADQRRTFEALVQARADEPGEVARRRRPSAIVGIVAFAAAATAALAIAIPRDRPGSPNVAPVTPIASSAAPRAGSASRESDSSSTPAVAPSQRALVDLSTADADRAPLVASTPHDEVITLRAGTVMVDARERRSPVDVVTGSTTLHVADAKVTITALAGKISHVAVIAGSVQMDRDGHHTVIHDDWSAADDSPAVVSTSAGKGVRSTSPVPPDDLNSLDPPSRSPRERTNNKSDAPSTPAQRAMTEFRTGWTELHAEHYDAAIAHFDRATDPVVSEDATYWAAIACERAGKQDDAVARLRAFMTAFPSSPRQADARRVLAKLGH